MEWSEHGGHSDHRVERVNHLDMRLEGTAWDSDLDLDWAAQLIEFPPLPLSWSILSIPSAAMATVLVRFGSLSPVISTSLFSI